MASSSSSSSSFAATLSWNHSLGIGNFGSDMNRTAQLSRGRLLIVAQKKVKKMRKVILMEDVEHVGTKGALCNVRAGYFRNFLLPLGKAQNVTADLLKEMRMEEERIEAEKQRVKEEAQQLARMFETFGPFEVIRKVGKGKQIFGSVTTQDLVDVIKAKLNRVVDKRNVLLPEIRETGVYIGQLKLHPEVTAIVKVSVSAA